jgi:branched-chain amino acid transport system permease protein
VTEQDFKRATLLSRMASIGLSPHVALIGILLVLAPQVIKSEFLLHLMISSLLFGTLAMGFDFTTGFIGIVNFGYAAFWGLGAYTSALLAVRLGVSPWLGIIFATLSAAIVGFLTGVLTLRLRGIFAAVMSWFVGLNLMALATQLVDLTRGQLGLNVPLFFDTAQKLPYYYTLLPFTLVTWILLRTVTRSKIGLAFKAIGQDLEAAQASGVNPTKYKVINFTLSCAIAGALGAYYAHFMGILTPDVMHTRHTVQVLTLAYVGGRGSIWGGLLAGFVLIPAFEYLKHLMELRLVIYGVMLILIMIFYPGGFNAAYEGLLRRASRWRSKTVDLGLGHEQGK